MSQAESAKRGKAVKCVVWDLDNTIWNGICLEDETVELRPGIREVLDEIRSRGIVQSIASKNESRALDVVEQFELSGYFVHPRVNWEPKEQNIRAIAEDLNIGLEAIAFIDDSPFELESVSSVLPEVRTYHADEYQLMLERPEFLLEYDTPEARGRGQMYVEETERKRLEDEHSGRKENFLQSLEMQADAWLATVDDLTRVSELVTRTNQFNSTGIRYSNDEIRAFFEREDMDFHVVSLRDRFGDYGRCGVALVRRESEVWHLEILLLSCRVAGRGLGTAILSYLTDQAAKSGAAQLRAKYIKTDRNRQIGLLYKIVGFDRSKELSDDETSVFVYDLGKGPSASPAYITLSLGTPAKGSAE